jgi:hypothetical protein
MIRAVIRSAAPVVPTWAAGTWDAAGTEELTRTLFAQLYAVDIAYRAAQYGGSQSGAGAEGGLHPSTSRYG